MLDALLKAWVFDGEALVLLGGLMAVFVLRRLQRRTPPRRPS